MPKGPIIDYIVVRDNSNIDFAKKVNEKRAEGYRCRGKMQTQRAGSTTFDYLQNMVKRGPKPAQPPVN